MFSRTCHRRSQSGQHPHHFILSLFLPSSDPGWDCRAWDQNLPAARCRLGWGRRVQRADQGPESERCSWWSSKQQTCFPFSFPYLHFQNLIVSYVSVSGQHSLCCDWLQSTDWGERKEDPRASVPLGSGRSGEPRTQWLPETAHHACVSVWNNVDRRWPGSLHK